MTEKSGRSAFSHRCRRCLPLLLLLAFIGIGVLLLEGAFRTRPKPAPIEVAERQALEDGQVPWQGFMDFLANRVHR